MRVFGFSHISCKREIYEEGKSFLSGQIFSEENFKISFEKNKTLNNVKFFKQHMSWKSLNFPLYFF